MNFFFEFFWIFGELLIEELFLRWFFSFLFVCVCVFGAGKYALLLYFHRVLFSFCFLFIWTIFVCSATLEHFLYLGSILRQEYFFSRLYCSMNKIIPNFTRLSLSAIWNVALWFKLLYIDIYIHFTLQTYSNVKYQKLEQNERKTKYKQHFYEIVEIFQIYRKE